jgi:hypothetical protein
MNITTATSKGILTTKRVAKVYITEIRFTRNKYPVEVMWAMTRREARKEHFRLVASYGPKKVRAKEELAV